MEGAARNMLQTVPAEIRLRIYEQMFPMAGSRIADWTGLFLSCKLFHFEMKHELIRNMTKYLESISAEWKKSHKAPLKLSTPTTLSETESLSVAIPNSYFRTRETQFPASRSFSASLLSLVQLGIRRLVFTRYEDNENIKHPETQITENSMADFIRGLLEVMDPWKPSRRIMTDDGSGFALSQGSEIRAIAFEWGTLDGSSSGEDLVLPYYAMSHPSDRTLDLTRDHVCGPATGAIWTRRQYTWYGQVVKDIWAEAKV